MYKKTEWKTKGSLTPGQKGTKRVSAEYGDALICVRYRYHVEQRRRIKTVELVTPHNRGRINQTFKEVKNGYI